MSTELVIGTPGGVVRARDVRVLSDPKSWWNGDFLFEFNTPSEQYIEPSEQFPYRVQIETGIVAHDELPPEVGTSTPRRRMRLAPSDFLIHGYTAGCAGCVDLRRKMGLSKNHSESCRLRMEECLAATAEGRSRKERESARREEEPTRALEFDDEKLQKDNRS